MLRHRATALATLAVLMSGAAGVAWGYFSGARGEGRGTLPVPALAGVAVAPAQVAGGLLPGGAVPLSIVVTNANPQPVRIGTLQLDPALGAAAVVSDAAGCANADVTVAPQTNGGAGWVVPARTGGADGALAIRIPDAIAMGDGADGGCQGAVITLHLQAGV